MLFDDSPRVKEAFIALADHCIRCRTCMAMDAEGVNLDLPCEDADRLNEAFKQARRTASV
ncbi:hypothetical protein ACIPSH_15825 [Streptomyces iakyrus]|uniref:hypothetical protein n=1 Tax=Streptomyces iakyrus TaxID=68219 RepID=UPI003813C01F